MGEMADCLLEHADYYVGGVLEAPRKTGGNKRHIHQQAQVETIPPNCRICGCRIGCRFESGTRLCLNRKSA